MSIKSREKQKTKEVAQAFQLTEKSRQDLKHAIISVVLGVMVTALSSLLMGLLHVFQAWAAEVIGGSSTTVAYLYTKIRLS